MHLQVLGDHIYMPESVEVPAPPWNSLSPGANATIPDIVLSGQLGTHIKGRLIPKTDSDTDSQDFPVGVKALVAVYFPLNLNRRVGARGQRANGRYFAHADFEGSFEMRGIPPQAQMELEARPVHYAHGLFPVGPTAAGETKTVVLDLDPGLQLDGVVSDEAGQPIEGAMICIHRDQGPMSRNRKELRYTASDAEGHFQIAGLPGAVTLVQAMHPAYLASPAESVDLTAHDHSKPLRLTLAKGESIKGIVQLSDGTPVPGILIEGVVDALNLRGLESMSVTRHITSAPETTSDAGGRFELTGLAELPYRLEARGDWESETVTGSAKDTRPGGQDLIITVGPVRDLAGQVLDPSGEPLTEYTLGVRRKLEGQSISSYDGERLVRVREETGAFSVSGLEAGLWELQVDAQTAVLAPPVTVQTPRAIDAPDLVLQTNHALIVRGTVMDADGQPVQGAKIEPAQSGLDLTQLEDQGTLRSTTHSQADGSFLFGPVTQGTYRLQATADGHCPSLGVAVEVIEGQLPEAITLQLRQGGTLTGMVFDPQGKPYAGRMVTANAADALLAPHIGMTDANG